MLYPVYRPIKITRSMDESLKSLSQQEGLSSSAFLRDLLEKRIIAETQKTKNPAS